MNTSLTLSMHILFGLRVDLPKMFWKALVIITPFLSFKGKTQAYLLKTFVTHNKYQIPLLYLLINCIFCKSGQKISSLKEEHTLGFKNFLIVGLCNSSAICWFSEFILVAL